MAVFRFPFDSHLEATLICRVEALKQAAGGKKLPVPSRSARSTLIHWVLRREFEGKWTPLPWLTRSARNVMGPVKILRGRWEKR